VTNACRGGLTQREEVAVSTPFNQPCSRCGYLMTFDAQELYRKFGFEAATERTMVRPRPQA
jgi:hypothetical protein